MKKRILALALALMMGLVLLAACGGDKTSSTSTSDSQTSSESQSDTSTGGDDDVQPELVRGNGETLTVMLMPQGDMDETTKKEVTDAINEILMAELNFQIEIIFSGGAWGFDDQTNAIQTGTKKIDIMPAHSWSGVTYVTGAALDQLVRLDNPDGEYGNLLELYGPDIYGKAGSAIVQAATIDGADGRGIYGMIIEKDTANTLGFLANTEILEKYDLTVDDFDPANFANWGDNLQKVKDGEGANFYPLNIEAEVLDRALNHILYIDDTTGPIGLKFDNSNPAGTKIEFISRYHTDGYKDMLSIVNEYYKAGFIDPDLGNAETAPAAIAKSRANGSFLLSSFVYALGSEVDASAEAGVELVYIPSWSVPVGTTESYLGSGLGVYTGSENVELSVQFLNFLNVNTEVADLLSEGIEGKSYTDNGDGSISRTEDRGGWNMWRYGVVGDISAATPLGSPTAWSDMKSFYDKAAAVECLGFIFDRTPVANEVSACAATISAYAVPLGSGAADPAQLDAFLNELEASGVQTVIDEVNRQYQEWANS